MRATFAGPGSATSQYKYRHIFGDDAMQYSTLARKAEGDVVEFLVTTNKQPNYLEYCNRLTCPEDPIATINQYTDHTTELYSHVNFALAADSPAMKANSDFIQNLRSSILHKPLLDDAMLYRGVDLSKGEIDEMESLHTFFIPSFTSTSLERDKAYSKPCLLVIKTPFCCKYACSITPDLSKFYHTEKEVLIACYTAFTLERIEKVNNTTVINLWVDEYASASDRIVNV